MRQFFAGCVFGIVISGIGYAAAEQALGGAAGGAEALSRKRTPTAKSPRIVGDSGYLNGVDVKYRLGEHICSDPWVWIEGRRTTVECNKR